MGEESKVEQLQKLVEEERQARLTAFMAELNPLLEKHKVKCVARPIFLSDGRVGAEVLFTTP